MDTNKIYGLNIKKLSFTLIILEAAFFTASLFTAVTTASRYKQIEQVTNDYINTQEEINCLKTASDFLTSKARQYVMTEDPDYAIVYFEEVNYTKRRESCVANIKKAVSSIGMETANNIEKALSKSNTLMHDEVYAMSLIASMNMTKNLPVEITSYDLPEKDRILSSTEKKEKAYNMIFGKNYTSSKTSIDYSVSKASEDLLGVLYAHKAKCTAEYNLSYFFLKIFIFMSALTFALISFSMIFFVLHPLRLSIDAIKKEELIPSTSTYEINYLATTYNEVYENNARTRFHLKQKAEHDALTGLLNRGAFENLKTFYSNASEPIAFMFIDVDNFKTINDTYGHETGDKALKRIAGLLNECFRINDFPARYGGDEFAVIMTEITQANKGVLERKLTYINESLQNDLKDGLPKLSVSVGIAFSDYGFTDYLMEQADKALYTTKANGRCGYTFAN